MLSVRHIILLAVWTGEEKIGEEKRGGEEKSGEEEKRGEERRGGEKRRRGETVYERVKRDKRKG
jgi:hypothetical protein